MTVQTKKMHGKPVQSKKVTVHVLNWDIEGAECRKPTKCMIKVAVKRALNLAHGYIHVDATGVSISRNGKYREKAFLPQRALSAMVAFDHGWSVKPFKFTLEFHKTTRVGKISEQQRETYTKRAKSNGSAKKKYDMRSRVIGLSVAGGGEAKAA